MQLIVIERAAPFLDHGIDQHADEAVIGIVAQLFENRLEIMLGLDFAVDHFHMLVFWQHHRNAVEESVRPSLDLPHILAPSAHLFADDEERQGHAKLLDPIAMAILKKTINQLIGQSLDLRINLLDFARFKRLIEHGANVLVIGIIARAQGRGGNPSIGCKTVMDHLAPFHICGRIAHVLVQRSAAKTHRVHQHFAHIGIASDDIHRRARHVVNWRFVAQCLVCVIRASLCLDIEQIDLGLFSIRCHRSLSSKMRMA